MNLILFSLSIGFILATAFGVGAELSATPGEMLSLDEGIRRIERSASRRLLAVSCFAGTCLMASSLFYGVVRLPWHTMLMGCALGVGSAGVLFGLLRRYRLSHFGWLPSLVANIILWVG